MPYDTIEIKNFRAIKHLVLNDLSDFNILIGKNNTGKSSCLEAIALLSSGNSDFKNVFKEDMIKYITFRRDKNELGWNYLVHQGAIKAEITGYKKQKENNLSEGLVIGKTPQDIELGPNDKLVEQINEQLMEQSTSKYREAFFVETISNVGRIDRARSLPKISNRLFFHFNNSKESLAELYETDREKDVILISKENKQRSGLNVETLFIGNMEQIGAKLHDKIVVSGKLHDVIGRLHENFPDITDLRLADKILYMFFKNGSKMPIETMGDGFKVTLYISMSSHAVHNGILLIEEPENYLHPALMFHLINELLIACKEHKIQIFVSSHNDEFIKHTLESSNGLGVSVIYLSKDNGDVEAEVYKKQDALKKINDLHVDLRGF